MLKKLAVLGLFSALSTSTLIVGSAFSASALDFKFSFSSNTTGSNIVPGPVEGFIRGLNDNATGAATEVEITEIGGLLGSFDEGNIATLWSNIISNSFTVTNGQITGGLFSAQSSGNDQIYFNFNEFGQWNATLDGGNTFVLTNYDFSSGGFPTVSITPAQTQSVPEPATLLGLLTFSAVALGSRRQLQK